MDLDINLAGLALKNPVLLASGTAGYGIELEGLVDLEAFGGIVLKSATAAPCRGNPEPRIWETSSGMLNSIGLENVGVESLVDEVLPALEGRDTALIASVAGETVREFARIAYRIESSGAVSALELNVSCPNVERGGIQFGADPGATMAVVAAVRENSDLPLFVKLSAAVTDIVRIADSAGQGGASGLSLINTIPGMAVDPVTRRARLGNVIGGLSGPAIKPVALKAVWDCFRATGMPIIGGGGICDSSDAVEFMIAGATAVAVGSAIFTDTAKPLEIVEGLPAVIAGAGAAGPSELVGSLRSRH